MKKLFLLLLSFQLFSLSASDTKPLMDSAVNAYSESNYAKAIELFDRLLEEGHSSAALFYNLGNSYFKEGNLGQAILHYEKALIINPEDEELIHNLEIANKSRIDKFEVLPEPLFRSAYKSFVSLLSSNLWAIISLVLLLLLSLFSYLFFIRKSSKKIVNVMILTFCLALFSILLSFQARGYEKLNKYAIITSESSYAKSGPGIKAEDTFILHEGSKVLIIEEYQNWAKVKLIDGKIGWLNSQTLETIIPI